MPLRDHDGPIVDRWTRVEAGEALAAASLITLDDAERRGAELSGIDHSALGLQVETDLEVARLSPWLSRVGLIAVAFPAFSDGRGFSIARRLRAIAYDRRLRASGPLIADQAAFLKACGFDEIETPDDLSDRQPEDHWRRAAAAMTLSYQRDYDGPRNVLQARRTASGR